MYDDKVSYVKHLIGPWLTISSVFFCFISWSIGNDVDNDYSLDFGLIIHTNFAFKLKIKLLSL